MGWVLGPRGRIAVFWSLIAAAVVFLFAVRGIVAPFLWALILAYLLNPVVKLVCRYLRVPAHRRRHHHLRGARLGYCLVVGDDLALLLTQIQGLGEALPDLVDQIVVLLGSTDSIVLLGFEVDLQPLVAEIGPAANDLMAQATQRLLETAVEAVEGPSCTSSSRWSPRSTSSLT